MSESIEQLALRTAQRGDWRIANWLEFEALEKRFDNVQAAFVDPTDLPARDHPRARMRAILIAPPEPCPDCDGSGECGQCHRACTNCDGEGSIGYDPTEEEYRDLGGGIVSIDDLPPNFVERGLLRKAYHEALAEHREAAA